MKTMRNLISIKSINQFTHNVNTPLATIKQGTQGLKDFLPRILDGYSKAMNANLITEKIETHHLKVLYNILSTIESSADMINNEILGLQASLLSGHGE